MGTLSTLPALALRATRSGVHPRVHHTKHQSGGQTRLGLGHLQFFDAALLRHQCSLRRAVWRDDR